MVVSVAWRLLLLACVLATTTVQATTNYTVPNYLSIFGGNLNGVSGKGFATTINGQGRFDFSFVACSPSKPLAINAITFLHIRGLLSDGTNTTVSVSACGTRCTKPADSNGCILGLTTNINVGAFDSIVSVSITDAVGVAMASFLPDALIPPVQDFRPAPIAPSGAAVIAYTAPTTAAPTTAAPTTSAPTGTTTAAPTTSAPTGTTTAAPTTSAPTGTTTAAPTTAAPTTTPGPTTSAPTGTTTATPTTAAPTTAAPTTAAPTTAAPTTAAPTTAAPTTAAPTTAAPTTAAPTTAAPTTAAPTTVPTPVMRMNFKNPNSNDTLGGIGNTGSETGIWFERQNSGGQSQLDIFQDATRGRVASRYFFGANGNGYINVNGRANNGGLNPTQYTVSWWTKPLSVPGLNDEQAALSVQTGNQYYFESYTANVLAQHNSDTSSRLTSSFALTVGTWSHIVVTYVESTKTMKLYKDGALSGTNTFNDNRLLLTGPTTPVQICARAGVKGHHGAIDYPSFWDIALNDAQVTTLYNSELLTTPPTPVARTAPTASAPAAPLWKIVFAATSGAATLTGTASGTATLAFVAGSGNIATSFTANGRRTGDYAFNRVAADEGTSGYFTVDTALPASYSKVVWIKLNRTPLSSGCFFGNNYNHNICANLGFYADVTRFSNIQTTSAGAQLMHMASQLPTDGTTWTHVVFTYDATTKIETLYRNGVWVSAKSGIEQVTTLTSPIVVGQLSTASGTGLDGSLNNVALYDFALTPANVLSLFTTES